MDMMSALAGTRNNAVAGGDGALYMRMQKKTMDEETAAAGRLLDMLPQQPAAPQVPKGQFLDVSV